MPPLAPHDLSTEELIERWRDQRRCIQRQIATILHLADKLQEPGQNESETA